MNYPNIALQGIDGLVFVTKDDILYATADGNYTQVQLNDNRNIKVLRQLSEVEQLVSGEAFFRIHRSNLVNLEHVIRLNSEDDTILMSNGDSLPLARDRKSGFIEKFTRI